VDINLTGQVAASLTQSPWISIGSGAIGGLVTGVITLCGVKMTQKHSEKKEEQNHKMIILQNKKQIYSELMGLKRPLAQTHLSYHSSNIALAYLNYIYNCQKICNFVKGTDSTSFKMYQEEDRQCKDLILRNAENEKDLWKIIGLIQVTFGHSQKLEDSIINISKIEERLVEFNRKIDEETNHYHEEFRGGPSGNSIQWIQTKEEIITSWKNSRISDARVQTDSLESEIDDLLKCLKDQIQEEGSALIG
jgi:hypothetical protein